jgi:hypothetical protein
LSMGRVGVGRGVDHVERSLVCIRLVFDVPKSFNFIPLLILFSSRKFLNG